MIERHNPRRRNLLAESRLVSEYLRDRYPEASWFINLRVGPDRPPEGAIVTDEGAIRLLRNRNERCDAVAVTPRELVVIEAAMWDPEEKIGKLLKYLELVPGTPILAPYRGRRLVGELVTGQHDGLAQLLAQRIGLRYVFWEPEWIADWYSMYPDRRRRPRHPDVEMDLQRKIEDLT